MKQKHKWTLMAVLLLTPMVAACFLPGCKSISLGNGGHAYITSPPFLRSLFPEASATIAYKPQNATAGKVVLWQDVFDGPIMLAQAKDTNVLFCLYDYDVDLRLFRINTGKVFKALPAQSSINHILFSSTWEIRYASYDEWQEFLLYLTNISPADFRSQLIPSSLRFRNVNDPKAIFKSLSYQTIPSSE